MELALHYHEHVTREILNGGKKFSRVIKKTWAEGLLLNQGIVSDSGKTFLEILLNLKLPPPGRVYFGNEFCEKRLPGLKELKEVFDFCEDVGVSLTLLTPGVTDPGIARLRRLLDWLAGRGRPCEVVVNDFGVLNVMSEYYPGLTPVWGRLMSNMKTMPRFARQWPGVEGVNNPGYFPASTLDLSPHQIYALQSSSFSVGIYRVFLKSKGIGRVELNPLPQGMRLPGKRSSMGVSLHYPWVYVTSSRMCEMGSMNLEKKEKFAPGGGCGAECGKYLSHWLTDWPTAARRIVNVGNTVFMLCEMPADALKTYVDTNEIDRIVFSLLPPL